MGWFSKDIENKQSLDNKNIIKIDNSQSLDITSDEIVILLIIITVLLGLMALCKIISMYSKHVKKQTARDAMMMKSMCNLDRQDN